MVSISVIHEAKPRRNSTTEAVGMATALAVPHGRRRRPRRSRRRCRWRAGSRRLRTRSLGCRGRIGGFRPGSSSRGRPGPRARSCGRAGRGAGCSRTRQQRTGRRRWSSSSRPPGRLRSHREPGCRVGRRAAQGLPARGSPVRSSWRVRRGRSGRSRPAGTGAIGVWMPMDQDRARVRQPTCCRPARRRRIPHRDALRFRVDRMGGCIVAPFRTICPVSESSGKILGHRLAAAMVAEPSARAHRGVMSILSPKPPQL